ncbi:hypothetical protein OHR86_22695 [Streptomyces sp. NBC_00441]|uniref:hypothetical protein n=1 Tax=Streptomyces sp. NBC_00441 TaxID=2975742 RepID=UPI002E2BB31C|nr:hypothetical protein [Streptomyces sp. NBC_00441]
MDASSPVGALLLCRTVPDAVRPVAQLLREPLLLAPAGPGWSVLLPEGEPWQGGRRARAGEGERAEPVDRVLGGWATALAVGSTWPVLALWWDGDRAGYTLASGFRRPVGYVWLADGTPAGEDEAMRTFAERLGLDPVLDVQSLEALTRPDPDADARARLRGLIAVLTRTGLALPAGSEPGSEGWQGAERIDWPGWRDAVKVDLGAVESSRFGPWVRGPRARALAGAQLAAGLPLALWGAARRSGGWAFAGVLLMVHGALGLAYDRVREGRAGGGE